MSHYIICPTLSILPTASTEVEHDRFIVLSIKMCANIEFVGPDLTDTILSTLWYSKARYRVKKYPIPSWFDFAS